jgi:hypothetical protein
MTCAPVASQIHQSLDIHRYFTAKITLDRKLGNAVTNLFHLSVGDILDLGRSSDTE